MADGHRSAIERWPCRSLGKERQQKQLKVDKSGVVAVNRIFQWFLHGNRGQELGLCGITARLNGQRILILGPRSGKGASVRSLTNRAYKEALFQQIRKVRRGCSENEAVCRIGFGQGLIIVAGDLLGPEREVGVTLARGCPATGGQLSYAPHWSA